MPLIIAIIVFIIIALLISWTSGHTKRVGTRLEKKYEKLILEATNIQCARNVLLYPDSKDSAEIDIAFATPKGIFCFECKHRKDDIYGKETADEWQSNSPLPNPFKQNDYHIMRLRDALYEKGISVPRNAFYNIVAVNTDVTYRKFDSEYDTKSTGEILLLKENRAVFTTKYWDAKKNMVNYFSQLPDIISRKDATEINNFLWDNVGSKRDLETHSRRVSGTDFESQLEQRRKERERQRGY